MAREPINLAEARAVKAGDSRMWTPLDALRAVIRDIEKGEIKPDRISIQCREIEPDDRWAYSGYCAGVTYAEHMILLEMARDRVKRLWRGEKP